ncbi:MAG TPA: HlyD family efflux transporter periplasmic adaptor subunit [Thermoanaerobaculia bacterium]|jgi:multidrug resistance efflux pump
MRKIMLSGAAALLLATCFSGYSETDDPKQLAVRRGPFAADVVLTGELEAARGDMITVPPLPSWQTSIKWLAIEGSEVKEGEKVVELDNSAFSADLDTKRQTLTQTLQERQQKESEWKADLEQKQLDVEKRKTDYDKAKILASVPQDLMSQREYEDRQRDLSRARVDHEKAIDLLKTQAKAIAADRANLDLRQTKAEREISLAEEAIESLVLRAPRDGIVVVRDIPWEARKLQAADVVFVGFPIAQIPELNSLQVSVSLPDVDDGRIVPGMRASVVLDGYPNMTFAGRITSISAVAQESARQSLRRQFKVVVVLDKIDPARMRPGLSARVTIRRESLQNALLAPRAAIDFSGKTPKAHLAGGKEVDVTLGSCNAQECVVRKGLEEGQRLAAAGEVVNG